MKGGHHQALCNQYSAMHTIMKGENLGVIMFTAEKIGVCGKERRLMR